MNNMNLFQQFIYYFQQNGGYVFQQFYVTFNFDLWRNLSQLSGFLLGL